MSLQFLTHKVLPTYTILTNLLIAADGVALTDGMVLWAFRGFVALCLTIIAYFLKKMVDDSRAADKKRDERLDELEEKHLELIKVTTAHEVMYEYWLEKLTNSHPEDGTRKTDQLHRVIQSIAAEKIK